MKASEAKQIADEFFNNEEQVQKELDKILEVIKWHSGKGLYEHTGIHLKHSANVQRLTALGYKLTKVGLNDAEVYSISWK